MGLSTDGRKTWWQEWERRLAESLNGLEISRHLDPNEDVVLRELYIFSDALVEAYATEIFIQTSSNGKVCYNLIVKYAKFKLAPNKIVPIC